MLTWTRQDLLLRWEHTICAFLTEEEEAAYNRGFEDGRKGKPSDYNEVWRKPTSKHYSAGHRHGGFYQSQFGPYKW